MIQFNLLPDIKLQYIKVRRFKRLVMLGTTAVTAVFVTVAVLLFLITDVWQTHQISRLTSDINNNHRQLTGIADLNKILTIQNQLSSLPGLHDQKPVASQLFGYLGQITPANITISNVTVDFSANNDTISFKGGADSLETVNQFVDTLKFTTYQVQQNSATGAASSTTTTSTTTTTTTHNAANDPKAFSSVVLTAFGRDSKGATYTIDLKFDPAIFDSSKNTTITVPPNFITTRSQVDQPTTLFKAAPPPPATTTPSTSSSH